jgi:hypothetical protein
MEAPGGKIGHAELEIGDSTVMLSDPLPQFSTRSPKELGGTSVSVFMYVEDVDAVVKRAVDAGATITMEVADQFWRPLRLRPGSVRPSLVDRDARRGRPARGDGGARKSGHGRDEQLSIHRRRARPVSRRRRGPGTAAAASDPPRAEQRHE